MASNIKILDPVQGLIDYVNDIKPYHTKVIESLVEYVGQDIVNVTIHEEYLLNIELEYLYDINVLGCLETGYGSLSYDDIGIIPILSPDPAITATDYPVLTSNSFTVLGDQRNIFDTTAALTFKIISFIEDRIIDVTTSVGSPTTGGEFYLLGDRTSQFVSGFIFVVTGSLDNDGAYQVSVDATYDGTSTKIPVDSQIVDSNDVSGFIKILDSNNNESFTVVSSIFTAGNATIRPYTTVFVSGVILIPPAPVSIDTNQRYISLVTIGALLYKKVLSYSNALRYYNSVAPASILQTPDEGVAFVPIINLSQGSPSYFVIEGNFENSNVFVGDTFSITGSTDNNDTYTIESIAFVFEPLISDYATRIGVSNVHDSNIDGFAKFDIPSNVFIIDGDYTNFFKQGIGVKVITGSKVGKYTTLYSKFINGETQIRVEEDIIGHGRGRLVVGTVTTTASPTMPANGFLVDGNLTAVFKQGTKFNVVSSIRNDGAYTVASISVPGSPDTAGSTYDAITNTTTIYIVEPFDDADTTGEIHEFVQGSLTHVSYGFGETPELCEVVPETLLKVGIKDRLYIDNVGIWTYDDIIAHGINDEGWGFDIPSTTIFASGTGGEPMATISDIQPLSPSEDTIWFDTSTNSDLLSAPGILKLYSNSVAGSPSSDWLVIPNNKLYWVDTDTGYMYYRIIYQHYDNSIPGYPSPTIGNNLDTGWILEYTKIPGYNEASTGSSSREQIGFETFFVVESPSAAPETVYNLSTLSIPLLGSPETPNPLMLEVYVNNAIASVDILSPTSFEILTPRLRIDDFVEVRVFDDTGIATNTFLGAFDTNASFTETFDVLNGYVFHIDGTESIGSPVVNKIYIPDTPNGDIFNIFKPVVGSPLAHGPLADTVIEIVNSTGSPNNDGIYTITDATQFGSPNTHVALTIAESIPNTGIFGGSPLIESGEALYQKWYQYLIVNTTANTIVVLGDATGDIGTGDSIRISHSYTVAGSPETNNNGTYTVGAGSPPLFYDGRNTIITTLETLGNIGNSGGWVESI